MNGLIFALLCCLCLGAGAQVQPKADVPERLAWTRLRGTAMDLSVGADGTAFSLDPDGLVWMRRPGPQSGWLNLPGVFSRIDAASETNAWALNAAGEVFRYNGTYWQGVAAPRAVDIGVSASGIAYVATQRGALLRFDARLGFVSVMGAPVGVVRVDVDEHGAPWVVLQDGSVQAHDGRRWVQLPGQASDVSAGVRGIAFMVNMAQQPMRWNLAWRQWTPLLAMANLVAAGPDNKPWIGTPDGLIFTNDTGTPSKTPAAGLQASVFSKNMVWRRVQGNARLLRISATGQVVALGQDGDVWQWKGQASWQRLPGRFERLAVGPSGAPTGLTQEGRLYAYRGSQWVELPGRALDVAVTPQGALWILLPDGSPAFWDPAGKWTSLNAPLSAVRLAVGSANVPWVVTREGQVMSYQDKAWTHHEGILATDLAMGAEGDVYAVDKDHMLARFDGFLKRWEPINNVQARTLAVGPGDKPWIINLQGEILASSLFDETPTPGGDCGALVGATAPRFKQADFHVVQGAARRIAIGKDGNVMVVDTESNLAQWRNQSQRFRSFPGQLVRIAVAADGKPWGITLRGDVWRHDGNKWLLVRMLFKASDIATACNGAVVVTSIDEFLYKYNVGLDTFDKMVPNNLEEPPPRGKKVALDPVGRPWTIRDDWVYRCDVQPCERQTLRAREIAIGPEGTLLAVDMDGQLQAFNARDQRWDRMGIDATVAVAVGPGGKPWIVRNGTEVWASELFKRQEGRDDEAAASTPATPVNTSTTVSPFTFSTTLLFDEVPYGGLPGAVDWPHHLTVGASGKVMAIRRSGSDSLVVYDSARRSFVDAGVVMPPGGEADGISLGPDDAIWSWLNAVSEAVNGRIAVYRNGLWSAVDGVPDLPLSTAPAPGGLRRIDLATAADGAVRAISPDAGGPGQVDSRLFRYDPVSRQFVQSPVQLPGNEDALALESTDAFWLVRTDTAPPFTNRVFQYTNQAFYERPPPAGVPLCPGGAVQSGCISAGANGSVYAIGGSGGTAKLLRWSAASKQWDIVMTSPALKSITKVAVAPDGRPWIVGSTDNIAFRVYKAR